jgi:hypothetical protein
MADAQLFRDDQGREVVKITTPSGVTAWVATSIRTKPCVRSPSERRRQSMQRSAQGLTVLY